MERYKFVSNVTGGIEYVEVDKVNKTYSTDYYLFNGGWHPSKLVKKREVKAIIEECRDKGYEFRDYLYPCKNCKYKEVCGDEKRREYCKGREHE